MTTAINITNDAYSSHANATVASLPFARFAETAGRIAETTKRLEKARLVAEVVTGLSDDDLAVVVRYLAGYAFPMNDQRTTNIGGSALLAAIVALSGIDIETASKRLVTIGDLGDLASELFAQSGSARISPSLTVADVSSYLDILAQTSGAKAKAALVHALLTKATPIEARFLVKLLAGDLRIGLQEGAVEDAIARWVGVDVGKVQSANMMLGDLGATAVRARHGTLDQARMRLFHPLKFMLATPAADLSEVTRQMPAQFIVEDKYDGIRAQAHIAHATGYVGSIHGTVVLGRRVALFSRTLDEITESFPDLLNPLSELLVPEHDSADGLILDGEILPMLNGQVLKFRELQSRLGRKIPTAELMTRVPVTFVAYDLLYANRELRIYETFAARRKILESLLVPPSGFIAAPSRLFDDARLLDAEFEAARARGNEGLMVKNPESQYKPGRRGREWLKIKRAIATLDVVVTAVEVGHGKRSSVLSDYTFAVRASESDPTLLNIGKAYSGLTDVEIATQSEWFREHTLQEFGHGRVRVVEPSVVIEVTFDLVQASKRHKSGYALRFPRIVRLRPDKPPTEIDTLAAVIRLAGDLDDTPPNT